MREEIVFSDLGALCVPAEHISEKRENGKWCAYSYETAEFSGSMLVSLDAGTAKEISLQPALSGWYRIFVGLYSCPYQTSQISMKLSGEEAYDHLETSLDRTFAEHIVEDVFWKCADMTSQEVRIAKQLSEGHAQDAVLAWLRFEPMTEEEVEAHKAFWSNPQDKRIYATNDMHCMLCWYDMGGENSWKSVVQSYADSDVEWLAIEDMANSDGEVVECDPEDFVFHRAIDKSYYKGRREHFSKESLREIIDYGHRIGLKMCVSSRIAFWCSEFPGDRNYFDQKFAMAHPEYRCVDRDGDVTEYLSFLYPEVQDHIIENFAEDILLGCDAVQPLFSRGWPYILFEEPFLKLFEERYDTDARELPLDDERIIALKCEIMNGFVRKLRNRIDEVCKNAGLDKRVELHAKVLFSVYDCKLVGLDPESWAKEGLVDRVVSDERRVRELLPAEVFVDNCREKIDLQKYHELAQKAEKSPVRYDYDQIFEPEVDSKGVLRGPASQKERIGEFMELEKKYGMKVYIEIMPRILKPEQIRAKALEIYEAGGEHIGLWDTYGRTSRKAEWSMWSRIGHKEKLAGLDNGEGVLYRPVRLLKIDGRSVRSYRPIWGG